MRAISFLATAILLCGCDGAMNIRGETPPNISCVITLNDKATSKVANTFQVSGLFQERVFLPGAWQAPPMTLTAVCGGKTVAVIDNPQIGEVNLGNIKP